jgi:hypothetical protein
MIEYLIRIKIKNIITGIQLLLIEIPPSHPPNKIIKTQSSASPMQVPPTPSQNSIKNRDSHKNPN